jgi:hypothetical protein
MHQLRAAHRLLATAQSEVATGMDQLEASPDQLEAGFDKQKDPELQKIELNLRKANVFFTLSSNHLYHKSNLSDIGREVEICASELNRLGHQLHIQPGILTRSSFALKGREGLVLQKLGNSIRIFFSV